MKKKDDKKKSDFVPCKFCTGNIDLSASNYFHFEEYSSGKLISESFFHENCWENKYRESVAKSAESFINQQVKHQLSVLQNLTMPLA
jgi:hypothetical protein